MEKQGNGASTNPETFWLYLKAKDRVETGYKFKIATFCSWKTTQKKHNLSHVKELDRDSQLHRLMSENSIK